MQKQHLPAKKSQLIPTSPADALRLANRSISHIIQSPFKLLPCDGSRASEYTGESLKGSISDSPKPLESPGHKDHGFPKQEFLELISLMHVPKVGVADVGHKPLTSQQEAPDP